ncbi:F-box/LRR-repeat protein 4-like [Daphnia carinata]|uniref:F-box/LRR-repeat protein 4-like n=1 Tax=Daphnia carinata TaxID=120202 RepID=UPI00257B6DC7|nr:F-box/LRR-repeat protein 4-like [Daphnia carinata]
MLNNQQGLVFIEQHASRVTCYSSQYGHVTGVSYTANNLVGPPSRFPAYGDFPETYVPRTYGCWWKESSNIVKGKNEVDQTGEDFIDVQFPKPVYPYCVNVYETYNSGCVRRLWAGDGQGNWKLFHEHPMKKSLKQSQIFSPEPHHLPFLTSLIRIEIDSSFADYYPEVDAVLLVGTETYPAPEESLKLSVLGLYAKVVGLGLHHLVPGFNTLESIQRLCLTDKLPQNASVCHLSNLPEEILRVILALLDLRSLCSLACASSLFNKICKDSVLFTSVNLKPYWYCVNLPALKWLGVRSQCLQYLDLSWCGSYGKFSSSDFSWFMKQYGKRLRILRLENCSFLNNEALYSISTSSPYLQELNLRGCRHLESTAFWHLGKLHMMERLILDSTQIELPTLLVSLQSMASLSHLSLGGCQNLSLLGSLDEISRWLNRHRPGIVSLDFWRSGHLSNHGMEALIGLEHLRELDIGWCGLPPNGNWISQLANRCRSLEKLFLTAARIVKDADLVAIAQYCPNLKQLDVLGNSYITWEGCNRVLDKCRKLRLLDVSYCCQIEAVHVANWRRTHPNVSIKRIFVNEED